MTGPLTRTVVRHDHALIAPDGHVPGPVPGWTGTGHVVLVAPPRSGFAMSLVAMEEGGQGAAPPSGVSRFVYVLEGNLRLEMGDGTRELGPQAYAYVPAGVAHELAAPGPARAVLIEKPYTPHPGVSPRLVVGQRSAVAGEPMLGDPNVQVRVLLPEEPGLDLAVNLMNFAPGASLPFTETHVMEHGLLMLEGSLVYRLGDGWYPVRAGDAIWMAPFCQQWCCCYGTEWASYLIYKDWHRDPQAGVGP